MMWCDENLKLLKKARGCFALAAVTSTLTAVAASSVFHHYGTWGTSSELQRSAARDAHLEPYRQSLESFLNKTPRRQLAEAEALIPRAFDPPKKLPRIPGWEIAPVVMPAPHRQQETKSAGDLLETLKAIGRRAKALQNSRAQGAAHELEQQRKERERIRAAAKEYTEIICHDNDGRARCDDTDSLLSLSPEEHGAGDDLMYGMDRI